MASLSRIESFVRSAELGSFSAAARRLGLTPAAVSKNVAALEDDLGTRLFQRSTRALALTDPGRTFLAEVGGGLASIQDAVANLTAAHDEPSGTLRVSMAPGFAQLYLLDPLAAFVRAHPRVTADWQFEIRVVDLIAEGFDAAIGGGFELPAGMVARALAPLHVVAVAAPSYLAGRRAPKSPAELADHDGVVMKSGKTGKPIAVTLRDRGGRQHAADLRLRVLVSDPESVVRCTALGLGIGLAPLPHALPQLASGALVRVLPGWSADVGAISIYFRSSRLLPARTRLFVDHVVDHFKREKLAARFAA